MINFAKQRRDQIGVRDYFRCDRWLEGRKLQYLRVRFGKRRYRGLALWIGGTRYSVLVGWNWL